MKKMRNLMANADPDHNALIANSEDTDRTTCNSAGTVWSGFTLSAQGYLLVN